MFISFKKMFDMLSDIDNNTNEITELKQAIKKLQSDKDNKEQAGKSDVQTVVNMSRASAGLTLLTITNYDEQGIAMNVITATVTTAHFNGEGIKIIKDGQVETFGTKGNK